jgi:hypothetical protein
MKKNEAIALCEKHGEFYIHYTKLREKGTTYLQGTTEFDVSQDKYLAKRFAQEKLKPADDKHILVFSRSSDKFRYIPVANIKRITSLNYELDRSSKAK